MTLFCRKIRARDIARNKINNIAANPPSVTLMNTCLIHKTSFDYLQKSTFEEN